MDFRRDIEEELKARQFELLDWTISDEYRKWLERRCEELRNELRKSSHVVEE